MKKKKSEDIIPVKNKNLSDLNLKKIMNENSTSQKLASNELKNLDSTLVFYETAPRILKTLPVMKKYFGTREIAVAREITKIYEECKNGSVDELLAYFTEHQPKGECVIMVAPPDDKENISSDELEQKIKNLKKQVF